jgi:hypothetical protein
MCSSAGEGWKRTEVTSNDGLRTYMGGYISWTDLVYRAAMHALRLEPSETKSQSIVLVGIHFLSILLHITIAIHGAGLHWWKYSWKCPAA